MKNDNSIIFLFATGLGLLIGFAIGFSLEDNYWQQEIVNKGFAEWHLVDGTRQTEFKWKENNEKY